MACTKQIARNSMGATANVFDSILKTLEKPDGDEFGKYYSLPALNDPRIDKLPYSIKILLESAIRNCDEFQVKSKDVEKIIDWENTSPKQVEIPFKPARVLLQDFTGVPAVVDLACMRDAMNKLGGDSNKINPLARAGIDYESSFGKARPNDTILKLQRTTPYYKRNRAHVCSFYVRGECTRGAECPYRHEMPITGELSQQNIKDRYYGNNDPVALKLLNKAGEMPSLMPPDDVSIKTLYVGGLDERVTEQDLRDNFYSHGEIESVRSFGTPEEVDAWLFSDPMRCRGALHFVEKNATVISYGVQTNSTSLKWRGKTEDPTLKFQIPLQIAAEREIARVLIGDPNFSWVVGLKQYAYPAEVTFSPIGTIGSPFFLAIAMFGFIFQIGSLVTEKELKLRQAMSIMGLYDTAYWLSWLTWETLLAFMSSLFTVLFGMIFRFDFFLHNNFAVVFLLFFIFQVNMVGFAFMIATFISKASSATTVGFSMFIVGFLTQIVTITDWPYGADSGSSKNTRFIWSLFPPNLLAKALSLLGDATATPEASGISWRGRVECPSSETDCLMTIDDEDHIFIIYGVMGYYFSDIDADYGFVSETHILRKNLNQEISRYQMETDDVFAQVTLLPENKVPDYCATLKADDWPVCAYISHDCRHMNATEEAHNIATTNRVWEKTLELTGLPSDAVEKNSSMLLIHGYAAGKAALSRDGFWGPIL